MNTTLVVIDVQPRFDAAIAVVQNVVHQIKLAKRRKDGIVVVEYGYGNPSYEEVYQALHNYDRYVIEQKNQDDGSEEVIAAICNNYFATDRVRVCGVNTCACVWCTAVGLNRSELFNRIEVARDACGCTHMYNYDCIEQLLCKLYEE